ncbi:MAG TPA: hypothetical protein VMG59_01615 [Phycisphaerae bacterium]|nr:hypothetical protein [Phycisphaerae bacterium]
MWKGEPVEGLELYSLLCSDDEFCAELGRAVLAAGRLETALKKHILATRSSPRIVRATLGQLIKLATKDKLLSEMVPALKGLKVQRNYLTHLVHALFSGFIEETILPRSNLLDSDVLTFTERAWLLAQNLNGLAEILEKKCTKPITTGRKVKRVRI